MNTDESLRASAGMPRGMLAGRFYHPRLVFLARRRAHPGWPSVMVHSSRDRTITSPQAARTANMRERHLQ
jgi:hypothetical protein